MKAPKEVIHELQFFVELLYNGVCGAEFVEQCQTPLAHLFTIDIVYKHLKNKKF